MPKSNNKKQYLPPKDVIKEVGISASTLRLYRSNGALKDIKWSYGGGKPYYEINEVKKLFHKN
jgi:DNA-binding transcriptional MerR regulator